MKLNDARVKITIHEAVFDEHVTVDDIRRNLSLGTALRNLEPEDRMEAIHKFCENIVLTYLDWDWEIIYDNEE